MIDPVPGQDPTGADGPMLPVKPYVVTSALLFAAAIVAYLFFDGELAAWLNTNLKTARRTDWMDSAKELGRTLIPLWLMALLFWAGGRRKLFHCGVAALALVCVATLSIKAIVGRGRPDRDSTLDSLPSMAVEGFSDLSFPSGEAIQALAIGIVLAAFMPRRWKPLVFIVAVYVAAARVLYARHFASDALAGAGIGIFAGLLALKVGSFLYRKWPLDWWRRPGFGFWILVLFPFTDLLSKPGRWPILPFFKCYGPLIVCMLLMLRGRVWLRWLKGSRLGPPDPRDTNEARMRASGWALLFLAALAVLPALPWTTLYDRDEGYYAECAREMIEQGDPIVPHVYGEPWMEKPPLAFDLMAGSMLLFGHNEFAPRFPSALCGLLALLMTLRLAMRMYPGRTGALAALILCTTLLMTLVMRLALVDTPLICTVLMSMFGLWHFLDGSHRKGFLLFFGGCGLGVLVKGPLGAALPVAALLGYVALTRQWRLILDIKPVRGTLFSLLIVLPWAVPAIITTDGEFFHEMVVKRSLAPVFSPLQGHGGGNIGAYLALLPLYIPVTILAFSPWSIFLLGTFKHVKADVRKEKRTALLAGWVLGQFVLFSLVSTKMAHYVLPFFPPIAIMAGHFIESRLARSESLCGKAGRRALFAGGILFAAVIAAAPFILGFSLETSEFVWFVPAAAAALFFTWKVFSHCARQRWNRAIPMLAAGVLLTTAILSAVALPALDKGKSAQEIAGFIRSRFTGKELAEMRIGTRKYREISFLYYLRKPVEEIRQKDIAEFLGSPQRALLVVDESHLDKAVREGMDVPYNVIYRRYAWSPSNNEWVYYLVIENTSAKVEG